MTKDIRTLVEEKLLKHKARNLLSLWREVDGKYNRCHLLKVGVAQKRKEFFALFPQYQILAREVLVLLSSNATEKRQSDFHAMSGFFILETLITALRCLDDALAISIDDYVDWVEEKLKLRDLLSEAKKVVDNLGFDGAFKVALTKRYREVLDDVLIPKIKELEDPADEAFGRGKDKMRPNHIRKKDYLIAARQYRCAFVLAATMNDFEVILLANSCLNAYLKAAKLGRDHNEKIEVLEAARAFAETALNHRALSIRHGDEHEFHLLEFYRSAFLVARGLMNYGEMKKYTDRASVLYDSFSASDQEKSTKLYEPIRAYLSDERSVDPRNKLQRGMPVPSADQQRQRVLARVATASSAASAVACLPTVVQANAAPSLGRQTHQTLGGGTSAVGATIQPSVRAWQRDGVAQLYSDLPEIRPVEQRAVVLLQQQAPAAWYRDRGSMPEGRWPVDRQMSGDRRSGDHPRMRLASDRDYAEEGSPKRVALASQARFLNAAFRAAFSAENEQVFHQVKGALIYAIIGLRQKGVPYSELLNHFICVLGYNATRYAYPYGGNPFCMQEYAKLCFMRIRENVQASLHLRFHQHHLMTIDASRLIEQFEQKLRDYRADTIDDHLRCLVIFVMTHLKNIGRNLLGFAGAMLDEMRGDLFSRYHHDDVKMTQFRRQFEDMTNQLNRARAVEEWASMRPR